MEADEKLGPPNTWSAPTNWAKSTAVRSKPSCEAKAELLELTATSVDTLLPNMKLRGSEEPAADAWGEGTASAKASPPRPPPWDTDSLGVPGTTLSPLSSKI